MSRAVLISIPPLVAVVTYVFVWWLSKRQNEAGQTAQQRRPDVE